MAAYEPPVLTVFVLSVCGCGLVVGSLGFPLVTIRLVLEARNCKSSRNSFGLWMNFALLLAGSRTARAIYLTNVTQLCFSRLYDG